jgi:hypothetical protein
MVSIGRQSGKRALYLIAFKENSLGRLNALSRNSGNLLSLTEPLWKLLPYILKESAERRQPLIARLGGIPSVFLQ